MNSGTAKRMLVVMSQFDDVTPERLLASTSHKWTAYPNLSDYDYSIGMWLAEMDYRIDPVLREFLIDEATEGNFGYVSAKCVKHLQAATAAFLGRFGCEADPARIAPIADVIRGLRLTIDHFTTPGSPVAVSTPAYMPFTTLPKEHGRDVIEVPSIFDGDQWRLDYEGIERAFESGAELYILCNPWNPAGRVFDREELERLSAIVESAHARVFEDCIHLPLILDDVEPTVYATLNEATRAHTVLAVSASKGWNIPGLKCAQLYFPNLEDAEIFKPLAHSTAAEAATIGIRSGVTCYEHGESWNRKLRAYLAANRDILEKRVKAWQGVKIPHIAGTYIAFLDFSSLADRGIFGDRTPAQFFAECAGVRLTEGASCGRGFEASCRMIFATSKAILDEALDRMERALKEVGVQTA